MPKGPKGQKPPVVVPNSPTKSVQRWDNEGGAPSMGDQSHKKGKDEKSYFGDEHAGSIGEMHFAYDNRKKGPCVTNQLANYHGFDWREWFVPPIVIPAVIIAMLVVRVLYLYL